MSNVFPAKSKGSSLETEHDLHIWEGKIIRNNISFFWTDITWNAGDDRIFEASFEFTEVVDVRINGLPLMKFKDYNVHTTQSIKIHDHVSLNDGDSIQIRFNHFIIIPE